MKIIQSPAFPQPGGHYSHCVEHNGTLYISGQLPIEPRTRNVPGTIEEQTELVLNHVDNILNGSGSSRSDVVQCRIYITNVDLWGKVNEVYARFFGDHKPARCIVPVPSLHYGCLIEIEVTAAAHS